jgi:hypothetical protein
VSRKVEVNMQGLDIDRGGKQLRTWKVTCNHDTEQVAELDVWPVRSVSGRIYDAAVEAFKQLRGRGSTKWYYAQEFTPAENDHSDW